MEDGGECLLWQADELIYSHDQQCSSCRWQLACMSVRLIQLMVTGVRHLLIISLFNQVGALLNDELQCDLSFLGYLFPFFLSVENGVSIHERTLRMASLKQ
jgi:hypothetical protein